ncbi:MAG TPA: glycoside hydrolase family 5 protein, partial [Steroidobacteraceae bacterium]|nr:glycoside hydrolase family 5 protein [Steroidobacteraceae bacterium]
MHSAIKLIASIALALISSLTLAATAVETHGALSVRGSQIVDAQGKPLSLAGPSLFWSNTGWEGNEGRYYNAEVVAYVQKNWNAGIIRVAIGGTSPGGYIELPDENMQRAERVIEAAIAQGMYVIVDWHSHEAETHPELAIKFFEAIATKYGKSPNIIYEIYNEPLGKTDWSTLVKPYAEKVIPKIRAIDPDNLIVVGTQTWSQDVDKAAKDPVKGFKNIAYTLHFYAGTHKEPLRKKAEYAMKHGIALMVTEWGGVNANGDGAVDKEETERWLQFMRKHHLTHCNWALSDKKEGASHLKNGTAP